jgi:hypothetical protein
MVHSGKSVVWDEDGQVVSGLTWLHERRPYVRDEIEAASYSYVRTTSDQLSLVVWLEVDVHVICQRAVAIHVRSTRVHWYLREEEAATHWCSDAERADVFASLDGQAVSLGPTITHNEFERVWLTGHIQERDSSELRVQILNDAADEGPQLLADIWALAESWYPDRSAGNVLGLVQEIIGDLLAARLVELVHLVVGTPQPSSSLRHWEDVRADRRIWAGHDLLWLTLTALGRERVDVVSVGDHLEHH